MRTVLRLLFVGSAILSANSLSAAEPKTEPKAGWLGADPALPGYQRTFKQPIVNKDNSVYQQSAHYLWTGNDVRGATATLVRNPEFKTAHAEEAMKKAGAESIKIGKKDAWFFARKRDGERKMDKIIVPLGDDKALIVEGIGISHKTFPMELANAFDLEKVTEALDHPPRTDFGRSLEGFRQLRKGMTLGEVKEWIGAPDGDIGSGIHVMEYKLPDQSRVLLGFPSFDKLTYVKHEKDGKTEELVK